MKTINIEIPDHVYEEVEKVLAADGMQHVPVKIALESIFLRDLAEGAEDLPLASVWAETRIEEMAKEFRK